MSWAKAKGSTIFDGKGQQFVGKGHFVGFRARSQGSGA